MGVFVISLIVIGNMLMVITLLTELKHQIERLKLHISIENRTGRIRAKKNRDNICKHQNFDHNFCVST